MRNARTLIAKTAAFVRPLIRLADGSCMSVSAWRQNVQLEAELIRKTRL